MQQKPTKPIKPIKTKKYKLKLTSCFLGNLPVSGFMGSEVSGNPEYQGKSETVLPFC